MSLERDLSGFILEVWPKRCGDEATLAPWIRRAGLAFPDVDLFAETRKAAVWEAEKASNSKRSVRRFLTNWWARTQESSSSVAPVISLSAVRWLSKNNKAPDFQFENWVRLDPTSRSAPAAVLDFCTYMGVSCPDSCEEVVTVFLNGV